MIALPSRAFGLRDPHRQGGPWLDAAVQAVRGDPPMSQSSYGGGVMIIDQEFQKLIPALLPDEYKLLEANIVRDGCREPLSVWNDVLVDGHNRYEICQRHSIKFEMR